MKFKVTRPDGTVIEAEGTVEELERIAGAPLHVRDLPLPVVVPYPRSPQPWEHYGPWWGVAAPDYSPSVTSDRITISYPESLVGASFTGDCRSKS